MVNWLPLVKQNDMLCDLCKPITISTLRDNIPYDHQHNLAALKSSAIDACDLCKLLWMCLVEGSTSDAIDTHLQGRCYGMEEVTDTAVWIDIYLHDYGRLNLEDQPASFIWVYSGPNMEYRAEQGTVVWGKLQLYALLGEESFVKPEHLLHDYLLVVTAF